MKLFQLDSGVLTSIPRNSYDYSTWTADTPTNVTEVLTTGAYGPTIRHTSATASTRCGGRYTTGTRITMAPRGSSRGPASAASGQICYVAQTGGGRRLTIGTGGANTLYVILLTDKDTYSAIRAQTVIAPSSSTPMTYRIGSRAGTVTAEFSVDGGINWTTLYTAADATAFGAAGAGTLVGIGAYTAENGAICDTYAPYALVEA